MPKILVIDDEELLRHNIVSILRSAGYEVIQAENGLAGIEQASKQLPDLIISDVMMPELDGYGMLEALRQQPATRTIPFIFVTGRSARTDQRQGMQLGADDYLTKPFSRDDLLRAVTACLTKQQAIQQKYEQQMNRLRSSIAYSLPHEFQTPLHIILMSSELLTEDYQDLTPEQVAKIADRIHANGLRLHELIQKFLLYVELELEAADPNRPQQTLDSETAAVTPLLAVLAPRRARHLGREADLRLNLTDMRVGMGEDRLARLLEEILDNAFKYSEAGSLVEISSQLEGEWGIIKITDHGRGLSPQQIARLGAYVQINRRQYEQQGSGLGLSIARRLADLHGGQISLESVEGQQTTVTIKLPLHK